jgi:hypothetical protein
VPYRRVAFAVLPIVVTAFESANVRLGVRRRLRRPESRRPDQHSLGSDQANVSGVAGVGTNRSDSTPSSVRTRRGPGGPAAEKYGDDD